MAIYRKWILVIAVIVVTTIFISVNQLNQTVDTYQLPVLEEQEEDSVLREIGKNLGNWRQLSQTQKNSLSKLGRILYLDEDIPNTETSKNYTIVVWKYGNTIEKRHLYHFSNIRYNPFEKCSAKNCRLSYNDEDVKSADIVLVHLHRTQGLKDLPPRNNRSPAQIWAFLTDESPYHTFMKSKEKFKSFNGIFNWSMTYRMDSDIPVPYGRTVLTKVPENFDLVAWQNSKRNDVLITIMGSNCASNNHRWEYVKELQKHIPVDVYGKCGKLKCKGHFESDCLSLSNYMFYLSFENSNCDEYITEKLWWNAYHKDAIPIVMGASKEGYARLLPPHSYINTEDFASPRDLANYLIYLKSTPSELTKYFQWKKYFQILNEHGYFKSDSFHYCRVCEALNYNNRDTKVYDNLESFWSTKNCYPGWM